MWHIPLTDVRKLWVMDTVRVGIPDDHSYHCVLEIADAAYVAPGLSLADAAF